MRKKVNPQMPLMPLVGFSCCERIPSATRGGELSARPSLRVLRILRGEASSPRRPFDKLKVSGRRSLKSGRGTAHAELVEARGGFFSRLVGGSALNLLARSRDLYLVDVEWVLINCGSTE